jgi:hypothetical protein
MITRKKTFACAVCEANPVYEEKGICMRCKEDAHISEIAMGLAMLSDFGLRRVIHTAELLLAK